MALMSNEESRQISAEFRPKFSTPEAFEASWKRCWDVLKKPSAESARRWLAEDLLADGVMADGLHSEPLLPLRSSYALNDCPHCGGRGYVRQEVASVESEGFGVARPCPACSDPQHAKTGCETCRAARFGGGYFGPETAFVPADWSPENPAIPDGWTPRYGRSGESAERGELARAREARAPAQGRASGTRARLRRDPRVREKKKVASGS